MRQGFSTRVAGPTNQYATVYNCCLFGRPTLWGSAAQRAYVSKKWSAAGTLSNLVIDCAASPGAGNSWVFTVHVNNVNTGLTVTIADAATSARDTVNTAALAPGDIVTLEAVPISVPTVPGVMHVRVEFSGSVSKQTGYASRTAALDTGTTLYAAPLAGEGWFAASARNERGCSLFAAGGAINRLDVVMETAPGAGKSRTFVLMVADVAQDGTGGTPDTTVVVADAAKENAATFTCPVSAGQRVSVRETPSGSPSATTYCSASIAFTATVDGEALACLSPNTLIYSGSTLYAPPAFMGGDGWSGTESAWTLVGNITTFTYSRLTVALEAAPGAGKSRTFTGRLNGVNAAPVVSLVNAEVGPNTDAAGSVTVADGDVWALMQTDSGGPASCHPIWGWAQVEGTGAAPAPTVLSIDPDHGPASGGTAVTITGTDFVDGATVEFDGVAATNVVFVDDTEITCDTPAHAAGVVDVVVENPDAQFGTLEDGYTYDPAPIITSIVPDHGPVAGGTAVTINGAYFVATPTVTFGGISATSIVRVSAAVVTCVTPAHAAGYVTVLLTNPDGQSDTFLFRYMAEPIYDPGTDVTGETMGYNWDELTDANGDRHCHTDIGRALNDPADYYGGRKAPVVMEWSEIERALSDYRGLYEGCSFGVKYTDGNWAFRVMHEARLFAQASIVIRTITDAARRIHDYARTLVRGLVAQALPEANRTFRLVCTDVLSRHFGAADDERQIPRRMLSRDQFTDLPTDQIGKAEPIIYGEVSDEGSETAPPVLTYDADEGGFTDEGFIQCGFGPLSSAADPPTGLTATAVAGGALSLDVPNGQYGLMATSVDADGVESDPVPFYIDHANGGARGAFDPATPYDTVSAGTQTIDAAWTDGANAVSVRVYLGVYYYGWRPLQMIEVAAGVEACSFDAGAAWPDVVPAVGNITVGATPSTWATIRHYRVSAVMADGETSLSAECTAVVRGYRRPSRVRWLPVVDVISYNIYGRSPGFSVDRSWNVLAGTEYLDDDWLDTGATIISGAPAAQGQVPVLYVGTELIDDLPWHRFLVCGHAVKAIVGVFQAGVRVDPAVYGVTWYVPNQAGWPFPDVFRDLGGRRYTLIYVTGPDAEDAIGGARPITLNVQGVEDEGDATGDLISKLPLQARHFLQNFGFGDWQTGAWLASPTFAADPEPEDTDVVKQIDDDSFDVADEVLDARVVGGAVGGGILGNQGAFITLREALARFCVSAGVDCGINRKTQFSVWAFDTRPAALTEAPVLSEVREIDGGSFSIEDVDAEHWNARPYSTRYDWARGAWGATGEEQDAPSIARYGLAKRGPAMELWFARTAPWATDVVQREVARTADPPRRARYSTPAVGYNIELGDLVLVTHSDGVGATGWVNRVGRVLRHIAQPDRLGVSFVVEDVEDRMDMET